MRKLKWRFIISLLTFFVGSALAFAWFVVGSKSTQHFEVSLPKAPQIQIPASIPVSNNTMANSNENSRPVRYVKNAGEYCEKYLLKKIAKENAEKSRTVKLKIFETDNENLSLKLEDWLETIHMDMLTAFEAQYKTKKVLILRANVAGATGIAANFRNWFVQFDDFSVNFRSLAEEPKLIFLDKDGLLNYYTVDYGDKFLENRDWNNVTLDLFRYRINLDGKSELLSEEYNLMCE